MTVKVTFLGTSGSVPTKSRGLPSLAVEYNGSVLLFDCGEGTQRQMMRHDINRAKVDAIFLTHEHGDHTAGIAGLARSLSSDNRTRPLDVYIPAGGEEGIRSLLAFDHAKLGYKVNIIAIKGGAIYKGDGFEVDAFRLNHTTPTYGFAFKEDDRRHFMKEKLKGTGLKGTMFAKLLKSGKLKVNGKLVLLKDITVMSRGVHVVYATDTRPSPNTVKVARNADLLVHEATYANEQGKLAVERRHSTAEESARLAREASVKRLVLTHVSARYTGEGLKELLREATSVFPNTEIAKDGLSIELKRGS
jgi:ribonuclease Z